MKKLLTFFIGFLITSEMFLLFHSCSEGENAELKSMRTSRYEINDTAVVDSNDTMGVTDSVEVEVEEPTEKGAKDGSSYGEFVLGYIKYRGTVSFSRTYSANGVKIDNWSFSYVPVGASCYDWYLYSFSCGFTDEEGGTFSGHATFINAYVPTSEVGIDVDGVIGGDFDAK